MRKNSSLKVGLEENNEGDVQMLILFCFFMIEIEIR